MAVEILLVEDDNGHAHLFTMFLRQAGISQPIVRLCDGQDLLDHIRSRGGLHSRRIGDPFVLVLDLNLPCINGFEALQRLRSDPACPRFPIMVLTTSDDPCDVQHSCELGCDDYLCKSQAFAHPEELVAHVRCLLALLRDPVETTR